MTELEVVTNSNRRCQQTPAMLLLNILVMISWQKMAELVVVTNSNRICQKTLDILLLCMLVMARSRRWQSWCSYEQKQKVAALNATRRYFLVNGFNLIL
jgi:hypothetical protein